MPRTLPDGRSESPGVLRIYMSSMVILALFYACSMVLSLILNGVAGILRAVGIMGECCHRTGWGWPREKGGGRVQHGAVPHPGRRGWHLESSQSLQNWWRVGKRG
jgi:hypothetical protein